MIKIEDIQEGSLWYEVGGKNFLWRLRFYNPNTKREDKVSIVFEEMSKSSNPQTQRIKLILEFLFLTGLRYCELAALKVENYDTDNKVISIESDIDYSEGISKKRHVTTKTLSSYRRVPLTGRAIDIIEQIISEN